VEDKEIIFGRNPVFEYLKSSAHQEGAEVYIADHAHGKIIDEIRAEAGRKKIPLVTRDKNFFHSLGPSSRHQGVAMKIPGNGGRGDADLLLHAAARKGVLVMLDQITDPHNAGAIIRTAEALGCDGIVIPKSHSSGITPTVIKAAAGATAHIGIAMVPNAAAFIDRAKEAGFWVIGTTDHGDRVPDGLNSIRPALVIIGSEGSGMRRLTEEKCDYRVRIPLKGKVSSLNASVAAGIILYEIMKS